MTQGHLGATESEVKEAFALLSAEMGTSVPAGRPQYDLDPAAFSQFINKMAGRLRASKIKDGQEKYELDPPLWLPASYLASRRTVQHAPYRIAFFLLSLAFSAFYLSFYPNSLVMCLLSIAFFHIAMFNIMFPVVTRPVRRALIDMVDARYGISWQRCGNDIVPVVAGKQPR